MAKPDAVELEDVEKENAAADLSAAEQDDEVKAIKIPYLVRYFGKKVGMDADGKTNLGDTAGRKITLDWKAAAAKGKVLNMARCDEKDVEIKGKPGKFKHTMSKLEPGIESKEAILYPVWRTSSDDLGDFGLGVGLYFKTIIIMGAVMFVLFILNVPTMSYFATYYGQTPGGETSAFSYGFSEFWVNFIAIPLVPLQGTAICPSHLALMTQRNPGTQATGSEFVDGCTTGGTDQVEIACAMKGGAALRPVYEKGTYDGLKYPMESTYDGINYPEGTRWINDCPFDERMGWLDLTGSLFLLLTILILGKVQGEMAEAIDEAVQTAQDYTVEVEDPGDTVYDQDPLAWKKYFEQFGKVTSIAIVKKNGELMNMLAERKAMLAFVRKQGWDNEKDDDYVEPKLREHLINGGMYPMTNEMQTGGGADIGYLPDEIGGEPPKGIFRKKNAVWDTCRALGKLHMKIEDEMAEKKQNMKDSKKLNDGNIDNARVYATFEHEESQRLCLDMLSAGSVWAYNDTKQPEFINKVMHFYDSFGCSIDMWGDDDKFIMNPCAWTLRLGPGKAEKPAWQEQKEKLLADESTRIAWYGPKKDILSPTTNFIAVDEDKNPIIIPDGNVLKVTLAPEPSDIRWENLDTEPITVFTQAAIATSIGMFIVFLLGGFCFGLMMADPVLGALAISVSNSILPMIMKKLNDREQHPTWTNTEASLLFKLVAGRMLIFGILPFMTTPWHATISTGAPSYDTTMSNAEDYNPLAPADAPPYKYPFWSINTYSKTDKTTLPPNIKKIITILLSDALLGPLIRVANPAGNFAYFYGTTKAKSQEDLDAMFKGASWMLAERFSDMTKTIYVTLFFSALAPVAYLLCTIAMFNTYWVDKYMLLRVWQVPPQLDASIVATTRSHLAFICLIHIVVTTWYYAGWPFDGVVCEECDADGTNCDRVHPSSNAHKFGDAWAEGSTFCTASGDGTNIYKIWKTTMEMAKGHFIYFEKRGYMTDEQWNVVKAYQAVGVIAMIFICVIYMGAAFQNTIYTLFFGIPKDTTDVATRPKDDQADNADYFIEGHAGEPIASSTVEDLEFYIPQFTHPKLEVPQIAIYHPDLCKTDKAGNPMHIEDYNNENDSTENTYTKEGEVFPWSKTPPPAQFSVSDGVETWFPAGTALAWNENRKFGIAYHENNLWNDPILAKIEPKDRLKFFSSISTYGLGDASGKTSRFSMVAPPTPVQEAAVLGTDDALMPPAPPSAAQESAALGAE
jgi:hypothetical protein